MEQIYMYTPAVHDPATYAPRPMPQKFNLIFLVPYTTLAPTFGSSASRALSGH